MSDPGAVVPDVPLSGPRDPWLGSLDVATVRRYVTEAEALGVQEFYFTGGEPFLHPDLNHMAEDALAVAPVTITILTNGTLIDKTMASRLVRVADGALYSLEIRVSLDGATAPENDAVRGHGSFAAAMRAVRLLADRGLSPIVTATEILGPSPAGRLYERLRACLIDAGVERPRIKILPV